LPPIAQPDTPSVLRRLPHQPPALLLTSGSLDREGALARGVRDAGPDDPHCRATGFLPQALLVEIMNQTAGLLLPEETGVALVAGFRNLVIRGSARRGERIEALARTERRIGDLFLFRCRAEVSGVLLAEGTVILRAL
jgi:3-hydroxymyristoyl/3-hydroxydecanoyl-(acyl carrier protein) dehydratase